MTRESFEKRHAPTWEAFETLVASLEPRVGGPHDADAAEFDTLYREICRHLALARRRLYGADLENRLQSLALRGHRLLYGARPAGWRALVEFAARGFPSVVRAQGSLVAVACLLFFGSLLATAAWTSVDPDHVYLLMRPEAVAQMESMYDPAAGHFAKPRAAEGNVQMFGFYVWNNVSIAFRTFAGGVLLGVGSIALLLFNGILIGAVSGHLTAIGFGVPFWSFVVTHGALELPAIALAGAAGLRLGLPLIAPGRKTRARALRDGAVDAGRIVCGVAAMLVLAAVLEAFWSASLAIPNAAKFGVGGALWVAVVVYFAIGGRRRAS
jgi:uncharacterized membrane protein SpoIIM required for sporulation